MTTNNIDPAAVADAMERLRNRLSTHDEVVTILKLQSHPIFDEHDMENVRLLLAALSARDEARESLEAVAREVCAALRADDLRLMINRTKALGAVLSALRSERDG